MDADRLFQDFDIHAAQAYRRWLDHVEDVNGARLAKGLVRPVPRRWWQQPDMLFLIASATFFGGTIMLTLLTVMGVT